jgi:antiviral helicase SKI2
VQTECGLVTSEEDFKEQFYFGLVEVVYEWSRGTPFSDIINMTDVQEG